jgi:hypothetical protein
MNRRFGVPYRLDHQANVGPNSLILFILMMEAIPVSETSFLTKAMRHHIPEEDAL